MSDTIPFSQLSAALTHLGFQKVSTPEFTAFSNTHFDAFLVLPREDLFPQVDALHLGAARDTVFYKGVASAAEFDQVLAASAQVPVETLPFSDGHFVTEKPKHNHTTIVVEEVTIPKSTQAVYQKASARKKH